MTQQPIGRTGGTTRVTRDVALSCVDPRGRTVQVRTTLGYRADDPYAVSLVFHSGSGDVEWVISRTLLLQGLATPTGEGDVKVYPGIDEEARAIAVLDFCSPDGRLVAQADSHQIQLFLARSLALVPAGSESQQIDMDALIGQLLGAGLE